MTRYLPLAIFALFATGCSLESASGTASSMRDGLTHVGEKVQSIGASEEFKNATDTAKGALTTTGEIAIAGTESAKEALTNVGATTVKVGEVAGSTLTAIGNTVIEAKTNLAVPYPAPTGTTTAPQPVGSNAIVVPAPPLEAAPAVATLN